MAHNVQTEKIQTLYDQSNIEALGLVHDNESVLVVLIRVISAPMIMNGMETYVTNVMIDIGMEKVV